MKSSGASQTFVAQAAKAPAEIKSSKPDAAVADSGLGHSVEVQHSVGADVVDVAHAGEIGMRLKRAGARVGVLTCSLLWNNTDGKLAWRCRKANASYELRFL